MENQQAICPNCGAHITNMQNCEFCGSLLVRLQQQGINIESSGYKDDSKVFKGLVGALKRNLDLQKATNHSVDVITDVIMEQNGNNVPLCSITMDAVSQDDQLFFPNVYKDGKDHLMVTFLYWPNEVSGHDLRLRKFRNIDIYELFVEHICHNEYGKKCYEYAINFGNDAEGAAHLISKVLHIVNSLPYETNIECYTNSGDDIEKSREMLMGGNAENEHETATPWYQTWWGYTILAAGGALIYFIIKSLDS